MKDIDEREKDMFKHCLILCIIGSGLWIKACYGYEAAPECFRKLEIEFFSPDLTQQAFSLHRVPQSSWSLIYGQLMREVSDVPRLLRERAQTQRVNPLQNPFDPDKSWEILQEVLMEVFSRVMRSHNAFNQYNEYDIKEMFEYIKNQQQVAIQSCLQKKKKIEQKQISAKK